MQAGPTQCLLGVARVFFGSKRGQAAEDKLQQTDRPTDRQTDRPTGALTPALAQWTLDVGGRDRACTSHLACGRCSSLTCRTCLTLLSSSRAAERVVVPSSCRGFENLAFS